MQQPSLQNTFVKISGIIYYNIYIYIITSIIIIVIMMILIICIIIILIKIIIIIVIIIVICNYIYIYIDRAMSGWIIAVHLEFRGVFLGAANFGPRGTRGTNCHVGPAARGMRGGP